jgi:hypothetical protein
MFGPKIPDKILPETKLVNLLARPDPKRRQDYILNNTPLHKAVLENNLEEVKKLLSDDKESKSVNITSLLNTPLLLALKLGNAEIAKQILAKSEELKLDINLTDARGLTALDWACMLRDDEVIKMILLSSNLTLSQKSYAPALYNQPVNASLFKDYLDGIDKKSDKEKVIAAEFAEKGHVTLYIPWQETYSDFKYFMKDICVNMGFMKEASFPEEKEMSSHLWFFNCLKIGYETFCNERNKRPVNKELLGAMLSQEALMEWRKTAILEDIQEPLQKLIIK